MKLRTNVRRAYVLALLVLSSATPESVGIGGGLVLIGSLIHFWASGYLAKEQLVVSAGPYRIVRNPFYFANVLIDGGLAAAASGLQLTWALAPVPVFFAAFYLWIIPRRVRQEESNLRRIFGEAYEEYCRLVPRYFPNPFSKMKPNGAFSMQNIAKNREVPRLINTVILLPLILLASQLKATSFRPDLIAWALIGAVAAGYALSILFRIVLKPKVAV